MLIAGLRAAGVTLRPRPNWGIEFTPALPEGHPLAVAVSQARGEIWLRLVLGVPTPDVGAVASPQGKVEEERSVTSPVPEVAPLASLLAHCRQHALEGSGDVGRWLAWVDVLDGALHGGVADRVVLGQVLDYCLTHAARHQRAVARGGRQASAPSSKWCDWATALAALLRSGRAAKATV